MGMSDAHPRGLEILLKIMQTVSWLGGLWGLFMLVGMVGNTLDSTQWKIRQKMVATLALVILIINWLDKVAFQEVTTHHGLKYFQLLLAWQPLILAAEPFHVHPGINLVLSQLSVPVCLPQSRMYLNHILSFSILIPHIVHIDTHRLHTLNFNIHICIDS